MFTLLATALQYSTGAILPPGGLAASYLSPIETNHENVRCNGVTHTQTEYRTKVVYTPVQRRVIITETVPHYSQITTTITQHINSLYQTKVDKFITETRTAYVTNVVTYITAVAQRPVVKTEVATLTNIKTRTILHRLSTTTRIVQETISTRTEQLNVVTTKLHHTTHLAYSRITPRAVFSTNIVTSILQIAVDRTGPTTVLTAFRTQTETSTAIVYFTPKPVVQDKTDISTTTSIMHEVVQAYRTVVRSIPVTSTQHLTVTQTIVDTVTTVQSRQVTRGVTETVRKVFPETRTIPVVLSTTVTVQRYITNEIVSTTISYAQIGNTSRYPDQTLEVVGTAYVTSVNTKTITFSPQTHTKIATVIKKCNTVTLGPQGYNYIAPHL